MLDIDCQKLDILKEIVNEFELKVVIISSWKKLRVYPYVEAKLIEYGIPIVGITNDNGSDRGTGIKKYVYDNNVLEYVVLDDDIFDDYDEQIMPRLVKTNFYNGGLMKEHKSEFLKILKK